MIALERFTPYTIGLGDSPSRFVNRKIDSEHPPNFDWLPAQSTATGNHPFFVAGKGWLPAGALTAGERIPTRDGHTLVVRSLSWRHAAPGSRGIAVYNFTVEKDHSYFVGNALGGAWAHNALTREPGSLHLPPERADGADPFKLSDQLQQYGYSPNGMPPIQATEGANGELMINDGVTRATRIAQGNIIK